MMKKLSPLTKAPSAFSPLARKVNQLVGAVKPIAGGRGIKVVETAENILISFRGLTPEEAITRALTSSRTFWVYGNESANLLVTPGAINNVVYAGGTITTPGNGHVVYIDATISGVTVTSVTVSSGASIPADSSTHIYTLLATVVVTGGIRTAIPVAWNYSQAQICGGLGLWGGFGS